MTTGSFPNAKGIRRFSNPRVLMAFGVTSWSLLLLFVVLQPAESGARSLAVVGASWTAQVFAGLALFVALRGEGGAERRPWMLFGVAVVARLLADVVWVGSRAFGLGRAETFQVAAHAVSYALLFGVLLWVMSRIRQEEVSVAALDTLAVVLTTGLLIRFFAPFPFEELPVVTILAVLVRPVCDLGLLFLSLAVLMTVRRPPFVVISSAGLLLLLVADGAYLLTRAQGLYELGFVEAFWSGGVMLLGFAVLSWGGEPVERSDHVGNFGVGLFWFGPFSPLLHYGFLLLWAAVYGPVPSYLLLGGVALAAILAGRNYAVAYAGDVMARRQEALALQAEQGRILRGLHDTVKQDIHGASMLIEAALAAQRRGDREALREILEKALEASREAGSDLSRPLDELRAATGYDVGNPASFFRERLAKLSGFYGLETHEDLAVPPAELSREELVVAQQIFVETAWNAAKHSGAKNFWLSMRREETLFVLEMRDDGRGYATEKVTEGLGLGLMRTRAEEVGATLCVNSAPGEGTSVKIRFGGGR
ncbi:MAG: histidine kinase [Actinobacteria bacterium]|nr:histidine kinase [Actinomycetota bacterium]